MNPALLLLVQDVKAEELNAKRCDVNCSKNEPTTEA
jgi:hypothetical protein